MDDHFKIQILQNIEHIGTSPKISSNLLRLTRQDNVDLNKIARVIMKDPTICAQVLKVANSAYFYRGRRINSIVNAVVHLGLENINKIIFAVEIIGIFNAYMENVDFNESDFWKHSLAGAMLAVEIGLRKSFTDTETLYLAGLLRNIGVLAVRQFMPAQFDAIVRTAHDKQIPFKQACKEIIGMHHRQITCLICGRWQLPESVIQTIGDTELIGPDKDAIEKNRSVITMVDAFLAEKKYACWDTYYKPVHATDMDLLDVIYQSVKENVNQFYSELWA